MTVPDPNKNTLVKSLSGATAKARSDMASRALTSVRTSLAARKVVTNSIGMKLIPIPTGQFHMGSPVNEIGREEYETQHLVNITNAFHISACQVTQRQHYRVMGVNPSFFRGSDKPVETVSWEDAVAFCKKLSDMPEEKMAGRVYRLPTEAEWEYACRAGSKTRFSFGDDSRMLDAYAKYDSTTSGIVSSINGTVVVGTKRPNAWGIYDMHGNVWEWCQDWFSTYEGDATDPTGPAYGSPHTGPSTGSTRVMRGGSWNHFANNCRSADRYWNFPSYRSFSVGFRIVLVTLGS